MQIFEKLTEIPMNTWIALAAIVIFGVVLLAVGRRVKWNAKMLACGALCIAMSFVLSYIRLLHMPQGGSITPASMLPVMMFAFAFGFGPGLVCAVAYGVLQMFQDMYIVGWVQAMLDYLLAYGALAVEEPAEFLHRRDCGGASAHHLPCHFRRGLLCGLCARGHEPAGLFAGL